MKRRFLHLSFLLLSAVPAFAEVLRLQLGLGTYTLHAFDRAVTRADYFGVYSFTGGLMQWLPSFMPKPSGDETRLHLFPNGSFIVSQWKTAADANVIHLLPQNAPGEDKKLAEGTFEVQGDRLTLQFAKTRPGHEELRKEYTQLHVVSALREEMPMGVARGIPAPKPETLVISEAEWKKLKEGTPNPKVMWRQREYSDWEKILRDYKEQKDGGTEK